MTRATMVVIIAIVCAACGGNAQPDTDGVAEAVSATLTSVAAGTATPTPSPTSEATATTVPRLSSTPHEMTDLMVNLEDFVGNYTLDSSNLATHPELDSIPGRQQMVAASYSFDITSVSNPQDKMLSFGTTCVEFADQSGAVLALQIQIEVVQDARDMKIGPLHGQAFGDESYAAEGTFPHNGRDENIAHVWFRAGTFSCQYTGMAIKGVHEPLEDVQAIVAKVMSR